MRRLVPRLGLPPEIKWAVLIGSVAHFSMAAAGIVLGLIVTAKTVFWVGEKIGPWYLLAILFAGIAAWMSSPSERARLVEGWRLAEAQQAACNAERTAHPESALRDLKACLPPPPISGGR